MTVVGVVMFLVMVISLHVLQPDYDPRYQLMSELALGEYGWAMLPAFLGLAIAPLGIQISITGHAPVGYRVLLIAASLCFLAAGLFPLGETSMIHISSIAMAYVLTVLAIFLFPTMVGSAASVAPKAISWTLAAGVVASVFLGHSILPMGIGQRLAAICLLVWFTIAGLNLLRMRDT